MENSKISWCTHTFNPWIGCTEISTGCKNCYARTLDHRWGHDSWGKGKPRRRTSEHNWRGPIAWDKDAFIENVRPRVFCASMADVFDTEVPAEWREDLFTLIEKTPNLDWLLLTKRPEKMMSFFAGYYGDGSAPLSNVWLGTTAENQHSADERIPILCQIPAVVHWLSVEPQLGPVTLKSLPANLAPFDDDYFCALTGRAHDPQKGEYGKIKKYSTIDWVIAGGESGYGARPLEVDWIRELRDQCKAVGTSFFMKQTGSRPVGFGNVTGKGDDPAEWPEDLRVQEFPSPKTEVEK